MPKRTSRTGFTLTEVLVVIAIIGVLMAISIPAVMMARAAAQKAACAENLRKLGQGVTGYVSEKGHFPPSFYTVQDSAGNAYTFNWVIALLPHMDEAAMFDTFSNNPVLINDVPELEFMYCPVDIMTNPRGHMSYGGNCGLIDNLSAPANPAVPFDFQGTGILYDRRTSIGGVVVPTSKHIKVDKDEVYDGLSNTLFIAEKSNAQGAMSTMSPSKWGGDSEWQVGIVWRGETFGVKPLSVADYNSGYYIGFGQYVNEPVHGNPQTTIPYASVAQIDFSRPAGFHSGIVNTLMCDGSVVAIQNNIDYNIYSKLMTPDSRKPPVSISPRGAGALGKDAF
jgi:prepilin-type N-terminal cleavage/methylation domain-containing protein